MKTLLSAFVISLLSPLTFAGEWHSAGNAPTPPYIPKNPPTISCELIATTYFKNKTYRLTPHIEFKPQQFTEAAAGVASTKIEDFGDLGMAGQSVHANLISDVAGIETVVISLISKHTTKTSTMTRLQAARSAGQVSGSAYFRAGNSAIEQAITCKW